MAHKLVFLFLTFFTFFFSTPPLFGQEISITEAFEESFDRPVGLEYSDEGSPLLYVIEQKGIVRTLNVDKPNQTSEIWFDISDKIQASGEEGLLGLAFHPDYPTNNTFYINYNIEVNNDQLITRISRFRAPGEKAERASEEILMSFEQPGSNHNGGQLVFGPEGYLYISLGDGGGISSRENSQDITDVYGDILRIDVNTETGYDIPDDNPFVNDPNGMDEIYSFGFRNPWRASFDPETGHFWVADVGETARESIYIVEKGKNYGWPIVEGTFCFESETCDKSNIEIPFYEYIYDQEDTGRSITGGYVYRGKDNPSLYGKYIYGDFISGRIWALEVDHETMTPLSNTLLLESGLRIPTFGIDSRGEIYIIGWGSSAKIYRFAPELTRTSLSLNTADDTEPVQLNWEVNRTDGIANFELYRGSDMTSLNLFDTVDGGSKQYSDSEPIENVTFYAVRAVETDGGKGEPSNSVSFYNELSTLSDSWELISVPFETDGINLQDAIVYSFDGTYSMVDQLIPGKAYWARSTGSEGTEYISKGPGIQSMSMTLNEGWNLIGAPVSKLATGSIIDEGGILTSTPIYGFGNNSYEISETLSPGKGYWIYAEGPGEIKMDLEKDPVILNLRANSSDTGSDIEEFTHLEFSNIEATNEFYSANKQMGPEDKNRYRLPPLAPSPTLDVRSIDGFKLSDSKRFELQVTSSSYPVTIHYDSDESGESFSFGNEEVAFELIIWNEGNKKTERLTPESESIVLKEAVDRIEFIKIPYETEVVRKTELLPNYPNPFNPTTNISYSLSDRQKVNITVFDAAGRQIATLIDGEQSAGQYNVSFNASGLASGIYFLRFNAGDVLSTQKLTLIK